MSTMFRTALSSLLVSVIVLLPTALALFPNDDDWLNQDWANGANGIGVMGAWYTSSMATGVHPGDSMGVDSVLVAVLDNAFRRHPDLEDRWYVNEKDDWAVAPGAPDDDDANGYLDDHIGWDAQAGQGSPFYEAVDGAIADGTHGTAVAGILAATANNEPGGGGTSYIAGVAQIKMLPVRVIDWDKFDDALKFARDMGADIITFSRSTDRSTLQPAEITAIENELQMDVAAGILVFGSVSELRGAETSCAVRFPADTPYVVGVSGVNDDGVTRLGVNDPRADACTGAEVDLTAPGHSVLTTNYDTNTGTYDTAPWSGTSFSTPMVAGVAALIKSYRHDLTNYQIRQLLFSAAQDIAPDGKDNEFGYGFVHAGIAAQLAQRLDDMVYEEVDLGNGAAVRDAAARPAIDRDPWGYTHIVYIYDSPVTNSWTVMYEVVDQMGANVFGPTSVEVGTAFAAGDSKHPDITVDAEGIAHIGWIEDDDIVYTRYNTAHVLLLTPTAIGVQSGSETGGIENLNILVTPSGINGPWLRDVWFVYEQDHGGNTGDDIEIARVDWDDASMYANFPARMVAGFDDDRMPSAKIQVADNNECMIGDYCIYLAYVVVDGNNQEVRWAIAMITGQEVVDVLVENGGGDHFFTYPSIDVYLYDHTSSVVYDRFDLDTSSPEVLTHGVRFARVLPDGTMAAHYPVSVGAPSDEETHPRVAITGAAESGLAWVATAVGTASSAIVYAEVGWYGVAATWSVAGPEVRIGDGDINQHLFFPQITCAGVNTYDEAGTYDAWDGDYRFVWIGKDATTGQSEPHYSSTRPTVTLSQNLVGFQLAQTKPDIAYDSWGGTHVVYEQRNPGPLGMDQVEYRYWMPGTFPGVAPAAFQDTVSPAGVQGTHPQVVITQYSVAEGPSKEYIFVLYVDGAANQQIKMKVYELLNGNAVQVVAAYAAGPLVFAADLVPVNGPILGLEATVFNDFQGTSTNPDNNLAIEPIIAAVWQEQTMAGWNDFMYGAVDETNTAVQTEARLRTSPNVFGTFSFDQGPGDRVYFAFADLTLGRAILQRFSLPMAAVANACWSTQLPPNTNAFGVSIAVERDLDRGKEAPPSSTWKGAIDNQIDIALGSSAGGNRWDVYFSRYADGADKACTNGGGPVLVVDPVAVVLGAPFTTMDHHSKAAIMDPEIMLDPANRPIIAYSAIRDIQADHQWGGGQDLFIHLVGLTNAGDFFFFNDMPISIRAAGWDTAWPALAWSDQGTKIGIVYDMWNVNLPAPNFLLMYQEAKKLT